MFIWTTYYINDTLCHDGKGHRKYKEEVILCQEQFDVFHHKKRLVLRKEMRHRIRCRNRIRFKRGIYEPYIHDKIDYFD